MRRISIVLLTLIALSPASLEAQTCRGLAPLPAGQFQASGAGMLAAGSHSLAAELIYDLPGRSFGGVSLGTTFVEAFEKSSMDLAASLGYQLDVGGAKQVQFCPIASTSLQLGPDNAFDSGVHRSTFSAGVGFTAGTLLQLRPLLSLVPALAIGVGHRTHQAESSAGARLFRIAETYGVAQFHVGFVVRQNLSIRPTLEVPLGMDGGTLGVGLTVGYHFGGSRPLAASPEGSPALP